MKAEVIKRFTRRVTKKNKAEGHADKGKFKMDLINKAKLSVKSESKLQFQEYSALLPNG